MVANNMLGFHPSGQSNQYQMDQRFRPYGLVTGVEGNATHFTLALSRNSLEKSDPLTKTRSVITNVK